MKCVEARRPREYESKNQNEQFFFKFKLFNLKSDSFSFIELTKKKYITLLIEKKTKIFLVYVDQKEKCHFYSVD